MKSEFQTSTDFGFDNLDLLEHSFKEKQSQIDSEFVEIKPQRSIPSIHDLHIGNYQELKQNQRKILSNIIKIIEPGEQIQVPKQQFQKSISIQQQNLPHFQGRLISNDQDIPYSIQKPPFVDTGSLSTRISQIQQHISESNFLLWKNKSTYQSNQIYNQVDPEKVREGLIKQINRLKQKVNILQNKLLQKEISKNKMQEQKQREYLQKIKYLQQQNQRLRAKKQNNSRNQSINDEYDKSMVQIIKKIKKIKNRLTESQKNNLRLQIAYIL